MTKIEKVINYIKENISSNKWKEGDKIFSKYQLSEYLDVSPNTVQTAITKLIYDNVLETINGSGTYVKKHNTTIIISANESIFLFDMRDFYRKVIYDIREKLDKMGYNTIIDLEKNPKKNYLWYHNTTTSEINIPLNEIAGVISFNFSKNICEQFVSNNIPVVSNFLSEYPNVYFDYNSFFQTSYDLIEKYIKTTPLIIEYEKTDNKYDLSYSFYKNYNKEAKYIIVKISNKNKNITKQIDQALSKLDYIPEGIFFTDDTLFINTLPLFDKYSNIFKKAKILTHSNNNQSYPENYKICRINFVPEEYSDANINILLKLINKEILLKPNFSFQGKIIHEELLKS